MEKIGSIHEMKPKRRCRSRRGTTQKCVINVAEARKEIALALHLHRSFSSQSPSSSCDVGVTPLGKTSTTFDHYFHMPNYNNNNNNNVYSCCSLMESMPMPEPIWSTTEPSVLSASSSSTTSKELVGLEFELGDDQNQASSYTWWVGFLKSLDGNISTQEITKYPMENSMVFGQCQEYINSELVLVDQESTNCVVDDGDKSVCSPDEWLLFPTAEDEDDTNPIP